MPTPAQMLTHDGHTLSIGQWSKKTGIPIETIRSRIKTLGYSVADALTKPITKKFRPKKKTLNAPKPCPPYTRHTTGTACARWWFAGKEHIVYFGKWDTDESREAYRRFAMKWVATNGASKPTPKGARVTVSNLIDRYLDHVEKFYRKDGKPTSEVNAQKVALRFMNEEAKAKFVDEIVGEDLEAIQESIKLTGVSRNTINAYVWRIAKCFRWGVGKNLVPPDIASVLESIRHLQPGRSDAPDPEPILAVPPEDIEAILPHLHADPGRRELLADAVEFMIVTGCRPGELCAMTVEAIDRSLSEWCYRVGSHKNLHRSAKRKPKMVWIGPKGQAILAKRLPESGKVWVFPPKWEGAKRTALSREAFAIFVAAACKRAGVTPWHPHQLRHNRATNVQNLYECDAAVAAAIGDTPQVATEIYADPSAVIARRVAKETG